MCWGWKEVTKRIIINAEEFEKQSDDYFKPGDYEKGSLAKSDIERHFENLLTQLERVALASESDISSELEHIDTLTSRREAYKKVERDAKRLSHSLKSVEQYAGGDELGIDLNGEEKIDVDNYINSSEWFNKKLDNILFDAHREVVRAVCDLQTS